MMGSASFAVMKSAVIVSWGFSKLFETPSTLTLSMIGFPVERNKAEVTPLRNSACFVSSVTLCLLH